MVMKQPKVSIIIPFKTLDDKGVRRCIKRCLELDYHNFDIYLLPDAKIRYKASNKVKIVPTGPIFPSVKRNIGMKRSRSEIIAFIDSDAYPPKDWLKNAVSYMGDPEVGAVGGPNYAPPGAPVLEQATVDIIWSRLCTGGNYFIRRYSHKAVEYKEIPSSNLIVKKELLDKLPGFDECLLTSEDSKMCWLIRKELNKKILFADDVYVYHHRRKLFWPHLRRILVEGRNKAWLFKELFGLSNLTYLVPSFFVIGLVAGAVLSFFNSLIMKIYLGVIAFYLLLVLVEAVHLKNLVRGILLFVGIPLTHIFYGVSFIYGLFTDKTKIKRTT